MRITKVYTKQGDEGNTRLGSGQEVSKDATRIATFGTVDELNALLGLALAFDPVPPVRDTLVKIQNELFVLGGDLCVLEADKITLDIASVTAAQVTELERSMDELNSVLQPLEEFILPGGCKVSAFLHQARCVCRRAERLAVKLSRQEDIGANVIKYLNRLSDALFVLARYQNHQADFPDIYWQRD